MELAGDSNPQRRIQATTPALRGKRYVAEQMASVRTDAAWGIDYLHLAGVDGVAPSPDGRSC
ncbi:hypothetical protein GCM10009841_35810 [Microlunatus panaciterrae]|uniref:Uncharacterized protein n=1 Tax=Microlunatus panaciterrae TaxID=400768 RepID=A0ABS2RGV7_9ACTN|nr:hypothetical protein [Microlunatus panaciterrae]